MLKQYLANWPALLTLIGAFLAALGGWWMSIEQTSRERQIAELQRRLVLKSEEIERLTKQNLATVTGGDSFAHLNFVNRGHPAGPEIVLVQSGEFPLYDVSVRIADMDKWDVMKPEQATIEHVLAIDYRSSVGNIAAGSAALLGRLPALKADHHHRFNVFFNARNGFWTQRIRLHSVKGEWKMATRVVRNDGQLTEQALYEKIEDGFPRNQAGQVDW